MKRGDYAGKGALHHRCAQREYAKMEAEKPALSMVRKELVYHEPNDKSKDFADKIFSFDHEIAILKATAGAGKTNFLMYMLKRARDEGRAPPGAAAAKTAAAFFWEPF